MFENIFGQDDSQKTPIDILQSLISSDDIDMKTDLNINQIKILCKIKWVTLNEIESRKPFDQRRDPYELFSEVIEYFKALMCSNRRLGRKEIIDAIKEMKRELLEPQSIMKAISLNKGDKFK